MNALKNNALFWADSVLGALFWVGLWGLIEELMAYLSYTRKQRIMITLFMFLFVSCTYFVFGGDVFTKHME